MLYENAWYFWDLNPRFYFQNLYFCKVNSSFPIFRGSFISICIGGITNTIWKCLVFLETGTPVFTSTITISAKLILLFRYLGGHLYPLLEVAIMHYIHHQELEIPKNKNLCGENNFTTTLKSSILQFTHCLDSLLSKRSRNQQENGNDK